MRSYFLLFATILYAERRHIRICAAIRARELLSKSYFVFNLQKNVLVDGSKLKIAAIFTKLPAFQRLEALLFGIKTPEISE